MQTAYWRVSGGALRNAHGIRFSILSALCYKCALIYSRFREQRPVDAMLQKSTVCTSPSYPSFGLRNNSLVVPRRNIVERSLEMSLRALQRRTILICLDIRVNELNQAIDVFDGDLVKSVAF